MASDLDIQSYTPTTKYRNASKFCNSDFGNIINGNFEIIADKRIRNFIMKRT
jgi:hypothetical protein